jgi:hypothetical protein
MIKPFFANLCLLCGLCVKKIHECIAKAVSSLSLLSRHFLFGGPASNVRACPKVRQPHKQPDVDRRE